MLKHFGAGNTPLLIDMTYEDDGYSALLGIFQELSRALANLADTSGR